MRSGVDAVVQAAASALRGRTPGLISVRFARAWLVRVHRAPSIWA
jgi:hypothetical protein